MTLPRPSVRSATMWVADMTSRTGNSATGASACACRSSAPGPVQAPFSSMSSRSIWRLERGLDGGVIGRFVLVTHSAGRNADGTVVERTNESVDFGAQARLRQFLWKAPKLASAGDRRIVVQEHTMRIAALPAAEGHRNYLAGFG